MDGEAVKEGSAFLDIWAGGKRETGGIRVKGPAWIPLSGFVLRGSQVHEIVWELEGYHRGCMLQCFQLRDGAWILVALQTGRCVGSLETLVRQVEASKLLCGYLPPLDKRGSSDRSWRKTDC
jgi:hypothetical protein